MLVLYEIWNEGTCGSCRPWVIFSTFKELFYWFLSNPQLDAYFCHLGGSAIFVLKCKFEGQNWDTKISSKVT